MILKIYVFESVEEAISILKRSNKNIIKNIKRKNYSKDDIVKKSISSNIFRAFHNLEKHPSEIYRGWASNNFDEIKKRLNQMTKKNEYDEQLFKWIYSFINYWDMQIEKFENRIMFGPAAKMVNLLVKTFFESHHLNNDKIIPFMHVPFDEFSLKPLINIINQLTEVKFKINIPQKPTMKYINTPELYGIIQKAVFKLCKMAEIHPIYYDYWCWNETHPEY